MIIGFSFHTSFGDAVAGVALLLLFGYAFSWVLAFIGLVAKSSETVNSVGFIIVFPLTFISSAFVPVASMPEGLQQFAEVNPFTIVVDALRHLWLGAPSNNDVLGAVVWSLGLIVVFSLLAVNRYRRSRRRLRGAAGPGPALAAPSGRAPAAGVARHQLRRKRDVGVRRRRRRQRRARRGDVDVLLVLRRAVVRVEREFARRCACWPRCCA